MWDDVQKWKYLQVKVILYDLYRPEVLTTDEMAAEEKRSEKFLMTLLHKMKEAGEIIFLSDQEGNKFQNKWPILPPKIWFEKAKELIPPNTGIELVFNYWAWDGKYAPDSGEYLPMHSEFVATWNNVSNVGVENV